jgi:hypothetical protein
MMKKYISTIFILLTIAGSSCKKGYLNLTDNPNLPSVASPNLLLSGALKTTADIVNGPDYAMYACWVGYMSWSTGFQANVQLEEYQFTTADYQGVWSDNYLNLSNYNAILGATTEPNYQAIADIMMAYEYEALVDNYNNVPFSDALQGSKNLNPAYQTGQSIYLALMKQLDAAITLIQKAPVSAANPESADIMFGGNMTNWILFANTLKLRLALRESTNPALSGDYGTLSAAVKATAALGYLTDATPASVNPGYQNVDANGGQQTPLERNWGVTQTGGAETDKSEYQANSYMANFFGSNGDPRLVEVYSASTTPDAATATGVQTGGLVTVQGGVPIVSTTFGYNKPPFGTIDGSQTAIIPSLVGPGVLQSPAQPAVIMSSAEALFLQAEGAAKGLIPGGAAAAATFYNEGIASSFEADAVPDADAAAATYSAQPAIAFPTGGALESQVKAIITQKWAALAIYGAFEAFNENRRTGYPAVPTSIYPSANAPNQVERIFYPFSEYETNAVNVAAEGSINPFSSKIFWAK